MRTQVHPNAGTRPVRAAVGNRAPSGVVARFATFTRGEGVAAKQARAGAAIAQEFLSAQGIADPSEITAATIENHLSQVRHRVSARTLLHYLSALRGFCLFLCRQGLLGADPTVDIQLPTPGRGLPRYLDPDEIALVLQVARDEGIWPEVCLALSTGLRLSELIDLGWADIDMERQCLTAHKANSRQARIVPLSRSALTALRLQRQRAGQFVHVFPARQTCTGHWHFVNRPRSASWWQHAIKPIQQAVPKFTTGTSRTASGRAWDLFRHTFAVQTIAAGVCLTTVSQWLGHANVRLTCVYASHQSGFAEIEAGWLRGHDIDT